MMRLGILLAAIATFTTAACATDLSSDEVRTNPVEPETTLAGGGNRCPQTLFCPSSFGSYDVFMYAMNYNPTNIVCWYRNSVTYATASTTLAVPTSCQHCCALGYCPDERVGTPTYQQSWTCNS